MRLIGEGGAIEGTIAFRHESEQLAGSSSSAGVNSTEVVPHIGDFIMVDVALRAPLGRFDIETRVQYKAFLRGEEASAYRHAPGADFIVRLRAWPFLHLFSSTFAEFFVASETRQDAYFFRNLTGVVLPGAAGDISIFAAIDVGHGKGAFIHREATTLGVGARIALE
jgi:hypothetical protein